MTEHSAISISDYRALAEVRYQIRRFLHFSEVAARKVGLEPRHHQMMLAIKAAEGGRPRIAYLAERLQIQHHSAVELLDRLARRGLIVRKRGDLDRREVHVNLTAKGERLLGQLTMHTRAELRSRAPTLVAALHEITAGKRQPKPERARHKTAAGGA